MKYIFMLILIFFALTSAFPQKTVKIYPADKKQSSGIYIKRGDKFKIEADGKWTLWDKYKLVGPEGHQYVTNEYGNWGLLLCSVGTGKPLAVGKGIEITSEEEGALYLFPNKGEYKIENSSGNIDVTITGGTEIEALKIELAGKAKKLLYNPKDGFLATDLYVEKDETIEIYAFGEWTMNENIFPMTNASGHDFTVSGIPWGRLFGGIGSSYGIYTEYFPIGEVTKVIPGESGILSLFPFTGNYEARINGSLEVYVIGAKTLTEENKKNFDETVRKNLEEIALLKINEIRTAASLSKLEINEKLSASAFNHAKYIIKNNILSRDEAPEKINFTGRTLTERLEKLGFKNRSHEMYCQTDSVDNAINLFVNTTYHRLRILNPDLKYFGYGSFKATDNTIHVFDFGYIEDDKEKASWETIIYPANNLTDVALSWDGDESPDPLPVGANKPVGSPVSILFAKKLTKVIKSEIIDESGKTVNSYIITPETDLNSKMINGIILVPKSPFLKNKKYTVNIKVMLDKDEKEYTWSFTTKDEIKVE